MKKILSSLLIFIIMLILFIEAYFFINIIVNKRFNSGFKNDITISFYDTEISESKKIPLKKDSNNNFIRINLNNILKFYCKNLGDIVLEPKVYDENKEKGIYFITKHFFLGLFISGIDFYKNKTIKNYKQYLEPKKHYWAIYYSNNSSYNEDSFEKMPYGITSINPEFCNKYKHFVLLYV